ncbi:hypothetical protein HKI87_11g66680 [Chloropicon roscoffensis]|uniref:Uncharacterized protein n=1 Tax=Chloropicon roscoffensis TaxID=1461544 RepID=A0AAX4PGB6_9CHLO
MAEHHDIRSFFSPLNKTTAAAMAEKPAVPHCPGGSECTAKGCDMMHPCCRAGKGCPGTTWLTRDHYGVWGGRRTTTCNACRFARREYEARKYGPRRRALNAIHNPRWNPVNNPRWNPVNNPRWNPVNNPRWNPVNNPRWNPVNNKKRQREAEEVARECLKQIHGVTPLMPGQAAAIAKDIMINPVDGVTGKDVSLEDYLQCEKVWSPGVDEPPAFYVGYTAQAVRHEALRFLTERGQELQLDDGSFTRTGHLNRPVLLHANDDVITQKQAVEDFGFEFFVVYHSNIQMNARAVEAAIQHLYQEPLPLGQRLWRKPDMGAKYSLKVDPKVVHQVFITTSPLVTRLIREQQLKVVA